MDYYDPWISGLLAEADYKTELQHVAKARLARRALAGQAARPTTASARREGTHVRHLFNSFTSYSRLLFRRRVGVTPWSSRVWPG